jgi:hypothetical protein
VICLDILIFKRRKAKHRAIAVAAEFVELLPTKSLVKPLCVGGKLTVRQVVKHYPIPEVSKYIESVRDTENELVALTVYPRVKRRTCQIRLLLDYLAHPLSRLALLAACKETPSRPADETVPRKLILAGWTETRQHCCESLHSSYILQPKSERFNPCCRY